MSKADTYTNRLLLVLFVAVLMLINYLVGTYYPSVHDGRLDGLHEVKCDDIVRSLPGEDPYLVCEINMQAEDDNIKIFRGDGAYND